MESWKPIDGYPGYEVSDAGRVRSLQRLDARGRRRAGGILAARSGRRGHLSVALYADGIRSDFQVHHLVLLAFVGPRPLGQECCHWNDDPTDNRVSNLRWDTRAANVADQVRNGNHHVARRQACPQGHPYSAENTYLHPSGRRVCQACRRTYRETHAEQRRQQGREYMRRRRLQMANTDRESA